jgi:hypothetical protein
VSFQSLSGLPFFPGNPGAHSLDPACRSGSRSTFDADEVSYMKEPCQVSKLRILRGKSFINNNLHIINPQPTTVP